jgi:putative DNA primase/helicase
MSYCNGDVIDLNDVWQPPPRIDLAEVRRRLEDTAPDWVPRLFPQGRLSRDRKTLRCADLSGRPPRHEGSCVIYLDGRFAGWGFDYATGESASPVDLIYHATGLTAAALFEEAAREARLDLPAPPARPSLPKPDHSLEIARILNGCQPLTGTVAERYLANRGLTDPACPDLLFNPDLADRETTRGWAGIVARVRNSAGELIGGIHRTFLLDDGSAKAPPGKKMLGPVADGSIHLAPIGAGGQLGIAEGIETALSASSIFGIPTWAALSADGLRRWELPVGVKHVTIFADAGEAGAKAAAALAERLNLAGIPSATISPIHGDDFNDDLRNGASAGDYPVMPPILGSTAQAAPGGPPTVGAPAAAADFEAAARNLTKPPDLQALGQLMGQLIRAGLEPIAERHVLAAIRGATGMPVSTLDKQLGELRRRLNATGDMSQPIANAGWRSRLLLDEEGRPARNEANVLIALENEEAFAGALVFDEFRQEILVNRTLPWDEASATIPRPWADADDVRLAEWLQRRNINVSPIVVSRSVGAAAHRVRIHPVRHYLQGLVWDGTPRIETWALSYLGAEDIKLHRAFGALWMISAVARIMRPGAKVDHMLILEGPQGAKKSTALKVLAGEEWFTDELAEIGSKDATQQMRGVWVIEIAELDAISRAEVSRIKAFLTRTVDRYRPPYGRYVIDVPRQCVFAGSVNPDTYLRDETGNRRFWPVRCGRIDLDALRRDRDQLWGEAMARFQAGAVWWLEDPELIALASAEQDARYLSDAWDEVIDRWLTHERRTVNQGNGYDDVREEFVPRSEHLVDVSVGEILQWAIGIEPGRWTKGDQMRVGAYLKSRKWQRYLRRNGHLRQWRYRRP